ncbi:hypothetical protein [Arthrobacter humicola]
MWNLTGLRSGRNVIFVRGDVREPPEVRDRVHVDDLAYNYEHTGREHDNHCCAAYHTHVMPHHSCMMR